MSTKGLVILVAVICLVLGGAIGYYGSRSVNGTQRPTGLREGGPANFQGRQSPNGQNIVGGRVMGQVQSVAEGRLTVQSPDNNSRIVLFGDNTSYQVVTGGSINDVAVGKQVVVTGQTNPDGSTTATVIQVVPDGGGVLPFGDRPNSNR